MLGDIRFPELIALIALALLLFGPGKLPDIGRAAGSMIREFKKGMAGEGENEKPAAPARKRGGRRSGSAGPGAADA